LQALASDALADQFARDEFEASVADRRSWHVKRGKGWRYGDRKRHLVAIPRLLMRPAKRLAGSPGPATARAHWPSAAERPVGL